MIASWPTRLGKAWAKAAVAFKYTQSMFAAALPTAYCMWAFLSHSLGQVVPDEPVLVLVLVLRVCEQLSTKHKDLLRRRRVNARQARGPHKCSKRIIALTAHRAQGSLPRADTYHMRLLAAERPGCFAGTRYSTACNPKP